MKLIFTLGMLLVSVLLFAQNTGAIEGVIRDATTGDLVSYATVQLEGTALGAISEDEGQYRIEKVVPGTYQLIVSYVGYESTTMNVEIVAGQETTQDVTLSFSSILGEEVVVTAMAMGQAKAINTQLSAKNIKNVVSEQKIRELPDANAAEALARLPGVSVTRDGGEAVDIKVRGVSSNTMFVNGMRLDGGLGSISSSMIGSIELSKSFMADQDADVLGGNVEFKMRSAEPGFNKDIWLRTGYNGFTKSFKMQDVSVLLSNRFLNDKLGVMLSLNYDRKDRGRDVLSASYLTPTSSTTGSEDILPVELRSVSLTHSENLNNRYGATLYADYQLPGGKLFYQAFGSRLNSESLSSSNSYSNAASLGYNSTFQEGVTSNFLHGVGGEHTLFGAKVDWGVTKSRRDNEVPEQLSYSASNPQGMTGGSVLVTSETTIQDYLGYASHDLILTEAGGLSKTNIEDFSDELAIKLDVEVPLHLGSKLGGFFKFGGKYRDISRGYNLDRRSGSFNRHAGDQVGNDAIARLPDWEWTDTPKGEFGHEIFATKQNTEDFSILNAQTYYFPDFNLVNEVADVLDDLLNPIMAPDANDYQNNEQYYAGYMMAGIDIGDYITFMPGLRFERYDYETTARFNVNAVGYGPYGTQGVIRDTTAGHFNEQFFPMFHLKIKPVKWFDIRLAATKTVTRPTFTQMSPRYSRAASLEQTFGDIYLKPQVNNNYDLFLSFYTKRSGLFTIGAFYKKLTDQVLDFTRRIIDPEASGVDPIYKNKDYTVPQNNQWPGYVQGLELDWQTHFSYLPKPWSGILLNVNMTFMQSRTRYPFFSFVTTLIDEPPYKITEGKSDSRVNSIVGMPDFVANVGLGYELGGFAGRISAYYQGSTITNAQASNKSLDQDKDALLRLDMQLSQKIKKIPGLAFYLNINNITNNPDRTILTFYNDNIVRQELYGVSGDMGVRYKF